MEFLCGRAATVNQAEENEEEDDECDQRGADADSGFGAGGEAVVGLGGWDGGSWCRSTGAWCYG